MRRLRVWFWDKAHRKAEWLWHYCFQQYVKAKPPVPFEPMIYRIRLWDTEREAEHVKISWYYVGEKKDNQSAAR